MCYSTLNNGSAQKSYITFEVNFNADIINTDSRADKLIDCALFDKSTKIGTEVA